MADLNDSGLIQETTTPAKSEEDELDLPFEITVFIFRTIFTMIIAGFGTWSNIVNLIIFYRQGLFVDNCTPSLVGLAIADFLSSFLGFSSTLIHSVLGWNSIVICEDIYLGDLWYISFFVERPREALVQITGWVTVYLSFERMVSVVFPFHVKRIFTPKRSYIVIAVIFVLSFLLNSPEILYNKLGKPENHWTYIRTGIISQKLRDEAAFVNNVVLRTSSFILIVLFNSAIIFRLKLAEDFKKSATIGDTQVATTTDEKGEVSNKAKKETTSAHKASKEDRVIRMMIVLCVLFITCYAPTTVYFVLIYIPNEWFIMTSFFQHCYSVFSMFMEYINSSVNMFVYYTMSTKYKKDFIHLFKCTD